MLIQIETSGFDFRFYHYLLVDTMADTAVFLYQLFHSLLQLLADDDVEKQSHSTFTLVDGKGVSSTDSLTSSPLTSCMHCVALEAADKL